MMMLCAGSLIARSARGFAAACAGRGSCSGCGWLFGSGAGRRFSAIGVWGRLANDDGL